MNSSPLTSRKTEREVRLRLDRLDEVLLKRLIREAIREALEAHGAHKDMGEHPMKYWRDYDWRTQRCACGKFYACVGFGSLCGRADV